MGDDNGHTSNDGPTTKRRGFLAATGAAGVASIAGCSSGGGGGETTTPPKDVEPASEINFISESTPPSVAIKGIVDEFQKQTGITVNMTLVPFNNYSEKIASDLTSKSGNYQAFYVDPYVVGAKYYPYIQSLDPFINSDDWADVPKGVNDFIDSHLDACGRYGDGRLRAFPYDCPTMMWVYRDDIINKYKEQAEKDLGFPFEPGPERTWQEYFEMAKWMNENVDEVPYGTGHQAKQHDSLQCDFHNVFWAHGAEDFTGYNGKPGDEVPKSDKITPTFAETGVGAAEFYKNLIDIAHPRRPGRGRVSVRPSHRGRSRCAPSGTSSTRCSRTRTRARSPTRSPGRCSRRGTSGAPTSTAGPVSASTSSRVTPRRKPPGSSSPGQRRPRFSLVS
nr:extracellular solute-binding protein [Halospeciosus flavus]